MLHPNQDARHLDPSDDAGHQQWRAEQMSAFDESYSSWRDDDCRRRLQAFYQAQAQDVAASFMKTLQPT